MCLVVLLARRISWLFSKCKWRLRGCAVKLGRWWWFEFGRSGEDLRPCFYQEGMRGGADAAPNVSLLPHAN